MDSEEEALEDLEFDGSSDGDDGIEEDLLDALEEDLAAAAAEASEAEDTDTDDTDNGSDDDDEGDDEPPPPPPLVHQSEPQIMVGETNVHMRTPTPTKVSPQSDFRMDRTPTPPPAPIPRERSPSPAALRRLKLISNLQWPRSFTVEAICAIPHPAPTHCLASSLCMTHLLTGSDDGYIRDYDIFAGVNGKIFLTAPQRHHCGVMEGLMKAAQIRCWWENPGNGMLGEDQLLAAPYSLAMHSDALWALAGSDQGHINLFTVRHEPGYRAHTFPGHRGPVSSLSLQHDEKGFFSAGWDGDAIHWDLNTGQPIRTFTSHGAQLTAVGVRPLEAEFTGTPWIEAREAALERSNMIKQEQIADGHPPEIIQRQNEPVKDDDEKSDFDPLFDDEPDADGGFNMTPTIPPALPSQLPPQLPPQTPQPFQQDTPTTMPAPPTANPFAQQQRVSVLQRNAPNAPPVLDPPSYAAFSPDVLMTASIDGQVILWDRRVNSPGVGVGRLPMSEKTRPWCVSACWSADGSQIYVGRRNATIDVWDVRLTGQAHMGTPRMLKQLRNPAVSGDVSCVVAFPDGRHLACASNDNIRLWNVAEAGEPDAWGKMKSGVQFKIIPGHHGGIISQMLVDRQARFLISASSNRGWHGESTRTVFVHEVKSIW